MNEIVEIRRSSSTARRAFSSNPGGTITGAVISSTCRFHSWPARATSDESESICSGTAPKSARRSPPSPRYPTTISSSGCARLSESKVGSNASVFPSVQITATMSSKVSSTVTSELQWRPIQASYGHQLRGLSQVGSRSRLELHQCCMRRP